MSPVALTLFCVGLILAGVAISVEMAIEDAYPSPSPVRTAINACAMLACALIVVGGVVWGMA